MKISVPTAQPDMEGQVGLLKDSPFLLAIELDVMKYQEFANPLVDPNDTLPKFSLVLWLVTEEIQILLVADSDKEIPGYLRGGGVQVIDGISGSVREALIQFVPPVTAETWINPSKAIDN